MSKRKVPQDDELRRLYEVENLNSCQIAAMCGATHQSVCRRLRAAGINVRDMKGSNHPGWKGGTTNLGDGYTGIWKPEHPRSTKGGYVKEHRLVIENDIGRFLNTDELVHHINGGRKDNKLKNLYLCSFKDHEKAHRSYESLMKALLEKKIIQFENGEYKLLI